MAQVFVVLDPQPDEAPVPNLVDNDAIYAEYMGPLGTARQALREAIKPMENGLVGHHSMMQLLGAGTLALLVQANILVPATDLAMPGWYHIRL